MVRDGEFYDFSGKSFTIFRAYVSIDLFIKKFIGNTLTNLFRWLLHLKCGSSVEFESFRLQKRDLRMMI